MSFESLNGGIFDSVMEGRPEGGPLHKSDTD